MRPWLFLPLAVLGATTLNGCEQPGDEQVQAASQVVPVAQPLLPENSGVQELAPNKEPVTWLDDTGDVNAREIDWDALIPEDWRPETLMGDVDIENLSDDDPRAQQLLDKLKALWSQAPVVPSLEGQRVKLPGFVVPLEMDAKMIDQFLLVPYYGACIHVPPPPANQTVHVVTREGKAFEGRLFDVVWVTGTMRVERLSSELAEAGYRLENASVAPFE
jgi:hypothetical protein